LTKRLDADTYSQTFGYPLAEEIPKEKLDAEVALLERTRSLSLWRRLFVSLKLGGPGFMGAALTLGAGTMTAAMLSGALYGYKLLWISWVSIGSGLFMMFAVARFTTRSNLEIIQTQTKQYGWMVGRLFTAVIGLVCVAIAFNFGQVALGTHLMESIATMSGVSFPQEYNWPLYTLVTSWLALSYGRSSGRGVTFIETIMKCCILLMVLCFAVCLVYVGIDVPAALKGLFVPWLPKGAQGIDLFIASSAAAVGVMDWLFFHYAGRSKGWGAQHEELARIDLIFGLAAPFLLITIIITSVFAATLHGTSHIPDSASDLSRALVPVLGETFSKYAFLIGFLAVPITTTVVMSIACAIGVHEALGWRPDIRSWRWKLTILLPQIAFLAAYSANPIVLIVAIAAALALTNNIVGWSIFLMMNDRNILGASVISSRLWNIGMLIQVTLLNCVAIMWVFNRLGLWG